MSTVATRITYFHGTRAELSVGDVLIPGGGAANFDYLDSGNGEYVWMHDNAEMAARYGAHVYEVEPVEWVENYSEEAGHDDLPSAEQEFIAHQARVVRVVCG